MLDPAAPGIVSPTDTDDVVLNAALDEGSLMSERNPMTPSQQLVGRGARLVGVEHRHLVRSGNARGQGHCGEIDSLEGDGLVGS